MNRSSTFAAVLLAAALTLGAPAAHANIVVNGGFETGTLKGSWTLSGNTTYTYVSTLFVVSV
jgi:hypothetical protein